MSHPRTVVMILWDGVELLDFAGPGEVFSAADAVSRDAGERGFEVITVTADGKSIMSQGFLTVVPAFSIKTAPSPDILIVPGGNSREARLDDRLIEYIKHVSATAEVVFSVCTGAFLLNRAGLLDGLTVTTYHEQIDELRGLAPRATVVNTERYIDSGKVITSAGVASGIDASFHLLGRLTSPEIARATALKIEYPWPPLR